MKTIINKSENSYRRKYVLWSLEKKMPLYKKRKQQPVLDFTSNKLIQYPTIMIFVLFLIFSCHQGSIVPIVQPDKIVYGGMEYDIDYNKEDQIRFVNEKDTFSIKHASSDSRHLSPCPEPKLLVFDVNNDKEDDVCFYDCGFMEVFINKKMKLSKACPIVLKFKENHWIDKTPDQDIDLTTLPGLEKLKYTIHQIDEEI